MTLILDSSVVITALTYESRQGHWSRQRILSDDLVAPHVMPLEVASALRFAAMRSEISSNIATSAYADLLSFQIELFPFGGLASRIWELRANVTTADAWYVALAEQLEAPLATLDRRLVLASGPRRAFVNPPET